MAMTGVRRGEALGLEWGGLDLNNGVVTIARSRTIYGTATPKTERGRRSIDLDTETVAVLKTWRKRQLEERMLWGTCWTDTGLVFTREDGRGYRPDGVTGMFERLQREYNTKADKEGARPDDLLPRLRLHDLRHTHATLLLAAGVNPRLVSERLRHASVGFTLDVAHTLPGGQREAVSRLAAWSTGSSEFSWNFRGTFVEQDQPGQGKSPAFAGLLGQDGRIEPATFRPPAGCASTKLRHVPMRSTVYRAASAGIKIRAGARKLSRRCSAHRSSRRCGRMLPVGLSLIVPHA